MTIQFEDVTIKAGLGTRARRWASRVRVDGDRWPDLILANDQMANHSDQPPRRRHEEAIGRGLAYIAGGGTAANMARLGRCQWRRPGGCIRHASHR